MLFDIQTMKPGLRVHIATVGFQVRRITEPLIQEKADKVYLPTNHTRIKQQLT